MKIRLAVDPECPTSPRIWCIDANETIRGTYLGCLAILDNVCVAEKGSVSNSEKRSIEVEMMQR